MITSPLLKIPINIDNLEWLLYCSTRGFTGRFVVICACDWPYKVSQQLFLSLFISSRMLFVDICSQWGTWSLVPGEEGKSICSQFGLTLAFGLEIECEISVYACFQLPLSNLHGLSHALEQHLLLVHNSM